MRRWGGRWWAIFLLALSPSLPQHLSNPLTNRRKWDAETHQAQSRLLEHKTYRWPGCCTTWRVRQTNTQQNAVCRGRSVLCWQWIMFTLGFCQLRTILTTRTNSSSSSRADLNPHQNTTLSLSFCSFLQKSQSWLWLFLLLVGENKKSILSFSDHQVW